MTARTVRRSVIFGSMAGGLIIVALVVALIVVLLPKSPNSEACNEYATGFNGLVDAVNVTNHGGGTSGFAPAQARMQVLVAAAAQKAHGKVATQMVDSAALARDLGSSNDATTAFFVSAIGVKKACNADGAKVTFHLIKQ